jgi:hypothetical protein
MCATCPVHVFLFGLLFHYSPMRWEPSYIHHVVFISLNSDDSDALSLHLVNVS